MGLFSVLIGLFSFMPLLTELEGIAGNFFSIDMALLMELSRSETIPPKTAKNR